MPKTANKKRKKEKNTMAIECDGREWNISRGQCELEGSRLLSWRDEVQHTRVVRLSVRRKFWSAPDWNNLHFKAEEKGSPLVCGSNLHIQHIAANIRSLQWVFSSTVNKMAKKNTVASRDAAILSVKGKVTVKEDLHGKPIQWSEPITSQDVSKFTRWIKTPSPKILNFLRRLPDSHHSTSDNP